MKVVLLTMVSNKEKWFQTVKEQYEEKLNYFINFEYLALKSAKLDRAKAEQKIIKESQLLLEFLKADDGVILLDEKGKSFSSLQFAQRLERELFQSSRKRIVFIIGGAFGVSQELKERAQLMVQMGPWTLNHLVAQTVFLEQLYRSLTIIKGLPYHNEGLLLD